MNKIEDLKKEWKYDEALSLVNWILSKEPTNEEALLQVADIQYMKWEISKAEKPVDFILKYKGWTDPMGLYVKWVLEMEKTNWSEAKNYLRKSLEYSNNENPEIIRCYGLSEYWSWNREKWINYLKKAFEQSKMDAEIVYNLIEINLLEHLYDDAKDLIKYYYKHREKLQTFGNSIEYYDQKIGLFKEYLSKI